jgi:class 3 adenylate cyclase
MSAAHPTVPNAPAPLPAQRSAMAILFADVSGSTRLYETQGDVQARGTIARCVELMTQAAAKHGGKLIKTIGDEVMCRFASADAAAAAALEMQEQVAGAALAGGGGLNVAIHVGFHFGPVVQENGDVFGDAVNVASRMVNLAKRDQVLSTGATVAQLSPKWREAMRQIDRAAVRGKSEEIDVYELVWQEAEATLVAGQAWVLPDAAPPGVLVLTWGAHELELSERHATVTIGRGEQNELVVNDDLVSRLHARIEYRNRRFSLTDQSTNGTYVVDSAGAVRLVRRDTHVLTGSGAISLGRKPQPGATGMLRYVVRA